MVHSVRRLTATSQPSRPLRSGWANHLGATGTETSTTSGTSVTRLFFAAVVVVTAAAVVTVVGVANSVDATAAIPTCSHEWNTVHVYD